MKTFTILYTQNDDDPHAPTRLQFTEDDLSSDQRDVWNRARGFGLSYSIKPNDGRTWGFYYTPSALTLNEAISIIQWQI